MSASLYVKDPAASRFVAGGLAEVEALFGIAPARPAGAREGRRAGGLPRPHPRPAPRPSSTATSRRCSPRSGSSRGARSTDPARDVAQYEQALDRGAPLGARRRPAPGAAEPLLARALPRRRRAPAGARVAGPGAAAGQAVAVPAPAVLLPPDGPVAGVPPSRGAAGGGGRARTPPSSHSLIDDGFAFTEVVGGGPGPRAPSSRANKRYRIAPGGLLRDPAACWSARPSGACARATGGCWPGPPATCPGLPREHYLKPGNLVKIVLSEPVLTYLLADPFGAGARLAASRSCGRRPSGRTRGTETFDAFLDLAVGLRRFEILSHVRERIVTPRHRVGGPRPRGQDEPRAAGVRVRRGGPGPEPRGAGHHPLPGPAGLHQHLRGADLRARSHPGALRGLRRLRARSSSASGARWTSTSATG